MKKFKNIFFSLYLISIIFISCSNPNSDSKYHYVSTAKDSALWGAKLRTVWKIKRETGFASWPGLNDVAPLTIENKVIFLYHNFVHCVNSETGETIWKERNPLVDTIYSLSNHANEMVLENDRLYIIGNSGVYCRNVNNGSLIWSNYPIVIPDIDWIKNGISDDAIFITSHSPFDPNILIKISKADGKTVWSVGGLIGDFGEDKTASWPGPPCYYNGVVYVGATIFPGNGPIIYNGSVAAFDAVSGKRLWRKLIPNPDSSTIGYYNWKSLSSNKSSFIIYGMNNGIIVPGGQAVIKMDFNGNIIWRKVIHIDGSVDQFQQNPLMYKGNYFVFNNGDGANCYVYSLNLETNNTNWIEYLKSDPKEQSTVINWAAQIDSSNNTLYKLTDGFELFGIDITTGKILWSTFLSTCELEDGESIMYTGGYKVDGKRIYLTNRKSLLCMEKVDSL